MVVMKFTVTYRSANGALATDVVEAASRTDCFAQMKARGIVPMSVKEGSPKGAKTPTQRRGGDERKSRRTEHAERIDGKVPARSADSLGGGAGKWIAALLILCVLGGGVWWWMERRVKDNAPSQPEPTKKTALPKEVTPAPATTAAVHVANTPSTAPTNEMKSAKPAPDTNNIIRAGSGMKGRKITLMDGTEVVHDTNPIFKRPFERMLHSAMRPGGFPLNMAILKARYSDSDIAMALATEEKIEPEDPENVVEAKQRMNAAKAEIRDFLKSGGTLEEAVEQIREHNQSVNNERVASMTVLRELVQEGNGEAVREFVKERNAKHRELGLPELKVPPQFDTESKENDK